MSDSGNARLSAVVALVAKRWDELPAWFGDRWPDTVAEIVRAFHALRDGPPKERVGVVYRLGLLFQGHPTVPEALRSVLASDSIRGIGPLPDGEPPSRSERAWSDAIAALGSRINAVLAEREITVFARPTLRPHETGVVTVRLGRTSASARVAQSAVATDRSAIFHVVMHGTGDVVVLDGPPERDIRIDDHDGDVTATFFLIGETAGTANITLDVLHHGVHVSTLPVTIVVADGEEHPECADGRAGSVTTVKSRLRGADVNLRIRLDDQGSQPILNFELYTPPGHYLPVGQWRLRESPSEFQLQLFRGIEREGRAGAHRRLGQELWNHLPEELRRAYLTFSEARTMQITSDEPWIPWELVCPYEHDNGRTLVDDEPWCIRFEMTRWLSGPVALPDHVNINSMAFVGAATPHDDTRLGASVRENRNLRRALSRLGVDDWTPEGADLAAVGAVLDQHAVDIGLWHVAGHGDSRGILLPDGSRFTPHEIVGEREAAMWRRRPLVVLNACRSARQDWSLSGLDGWVKKFVHGCGAAFVGTQWDVTDDVAEHLIGKFYEQLCRGEGMGAAMNAARRATRERWPDDSSWLAYSVYAHPDTTVTFGTG